MKKYIFILAAALCSCSENEELPVAGEMEVSLQVSVPEGFRTRAESYYGDGADNPIFFKYAIYRPDGSVAYSSEKADSPEATLNGVGEWSIPVRLMRDEEYTAIFWADQFGDNNSPYTVTLDDPDNAGLSIEYAKAFDAEHLKSDRTDAYYAYETFTVDGLKTFTMRRPFIQVNIGSNEEDIVAGGAWHNAKVCVGFTDGTEQWADAKVTFKDGKATEQLFHSLGEMQVSSFDASGYTFYGNPDVQYMYMAYLPCVGDEKNLAIHIENPDGETRDYTVNVDGMIKPNSRLIIVPACTELGDGADPNPDPEKDGFISQAGANMQFNIMFDPDFAAADEISFTEAHILTNNLFAGTFADGSTYQDWCIAWHPTRSVNDMVIVPLNVNESLQFHTILDLPTSLYRMFSHTNRLTTITDFPSTKNVTDMGGMFSGCWALTYIDFSNFDTHNVTDMASMFSNCSKLTELDLSGFDTRKVINMGYMFEGCSNLTSLNLSNFDISKVVVMDGMFGSCSKLTHIKCTTAFRDWCWANASKIKLPAAMQEGGSGTWELID